MTLSFLRLLQFSSPTLPVGGYAYSQGLESAIDAGLVGNQQQVYQWVQGVLNNSIKQVDLVALNHLLICIREGRLDELRSINEHVLALRETSELRSESADMAKALVRLLHKLPLPEWSKYVIDRVCNEPLDWVTAFSLALGLHEISVSESMSAYAWSWCENQVAVAIKLIPLGQTVGQTLLYQLAEDVERAVKQAQAIKLDDMGASLPGLAILSSKHETQYSRLFRS